MDIIEYYSLNEDFHKLIESECGIINLIERLQDSRLHMIDNNLIKDYGVNLYNEMTIVTALNLNLLTYLHSNKILTNFK